MGSGAAELEAQAEVGGAKLAVRQAVERRMPIATVRSKTHPRQDSSARLGTEHLGGREIVAVTQKSHTQIRGVCDSAPMGDQWPTLIPQIAVADAAQRELRMQVSTTDD